MKYLPLLAVALLAGCEAPQRAGHITYTRLSVTDPSGNSIAEWVGEGRVRKSEQGYDILAVERQSGPPDPVVMRYPNRRPATVVGPNIVLQEIEKPAWLRELDGEAR